MKVKQKKRRFIVLRTPVLMEDEGRHELIGVFDTRAAAEVAIKEHGAGYFRASDYVITREPKR